MKSFNDALKIDGNNNVALVGLARLQLATGSAAEAVPLLMKVVGTESHEPRGSPPAAQWIHRHRRRRRRRQPRKRPAEDQCRFAGSPDGGRDAWPAFKKDDAAARQAYNRALAADPRSFQALAGLLNAELKGKNFGAARALIEKQLAQNPNDPNLNLLAAQTYGLLGDAAAMEEALKKTVQADPHSLEAYSMLAGMYYKQGRLDYARNELEKFVSTAPASVPGNTMLGTVLDMQGKKQEAKKRYTTALQVDPRAAVAANNLAWIDANTEGGNLDMALQLAQTAKAQLPNQHEVDDTLGLDLLQEGHGYASHRILREQHAEAADQSDVCLSPRPRLPEERRHGEGARRNWNGR